MVREQIRVRGIVQGVGFRPTVYRLAKAGGLLGDVCNDGEGVLIRVSGSDAAITEFISQLYAECPPLAHIQELTRKVDRDAGTFHDFVIADSVNNAVNTQIAPDAASCPQCQAEIFNPFSRFYRYPFTNCTHCGPRLTIIRAIPYDRCNTSMSTFVMCSDCAQEYHDVGNRRFHAQPVACYNCGPMAWLERADGKPVTASMFSMLDDVDAVCTLLQKGHIVAIKGLGGINLACDATQAATVAKLRQRKRRYDKPFAVMARDIEVITEYCFVSSQERELLTSAAAPIVLLNKKPSSNIAPEVAPTQNTLGFVLPYTPLHHLILRRMNRPIVFTSGNLADEPQCIDNDDARERLGEIADYFLWHNREIVNLVDDSVARIMNNQVRILRRARGYAPAPIKLPPGFEQVPPILAMGSELKSTFCLLRPGEAIVSQHLGDLENHASFQAYENTLKLYLSLFEHQPQAIAIDQHPEYLATKLGKQLADIHQLPLHPCQHHHAHIAACMAENGIPLDAPPVLGVALDGLGYGTDGTFWGGEFLLTDYRQFRRLATFKPVAMIGGAKAIYQPWRNTYAHLLSARLWQTCQQQYTDLEIIRFLQQQPLKLLEQMVSQNINCTPASSVGRLFDAVAAAVGICRQECSYEGQGAMTLESLVDTHRLNNPKEIENYPFSLNFLDSIYYIDSQPIWLPLLDDLQQQLSPSIIATKFHQSLAHSLVHLIQKLCEAQEIKQVALTGGVFQNSILFNQVIHDLDKLNIKAITHSLLPPNDGNLSLGQAVITAAQTIGT